MPRDRTAALEACHAALSECREPLPHLPTLIAPKAEGRLYGDEFLQVQIDHGLQSFPVAVSRVASGKASSQLAYSA